MTFKPFYVSVISLAVMSIGLVVASDAHQASSGWSYPPACCKGNDVGGDCHAIPGSGVSKGRRGFSVVLNPGDHHLATKPHSFFIPYRGHGSLLLLPVVAGGGTLSRSSFGLTLPPL